MNDKEIIELYWNRDEKAIGATAKQYGAYCYSISYGILHNPEDSKECVNDTYMSAWNSIPPHKPNVLATFLGKITRRISVDKLRKKHAEKRGGEMPELFRELSGCVSSDGNPATEAEKKLLDETVSRFIGQLKETERNLFICRYWYAASVKEIAKRFGFSESKVKITLMRIRNKLRLQLEKEGLL